MASMVVCESCHQSFLTLHKLQNHKCLYCNICGKILSSYQKLTEHQMKCGKDVACAFCKKDFSSNARLQKHQCTFCKNCQKIYSSRQKLAQHQKTCQLQTKKPVEADENVIFTRADSLTYLFKPVHNQWQTQRCTQLGLDVVRNHPPQLEQNLGPPDRLQCVLGDGNCFFRAVSVALSGDQNSHIKLREAMIQYMLMNPLLMQRLLPKEMDINQHIHQTLMNQNGTWATQVEIFAMAALLKTDIFVYTYHGRSWQWLKHSAQLLQPGLIVHSNSIYLKHTGLNHYNFVQTVTSQQSLSASTFDFKNCDLNSSNVKGYSVDHILNCRAKETMQHKCEGRSSLNDQQNLKLKSKVYKDKDKYIKRQKREDEDFRQKERDRRNSQRRLKRENEEVRENERHVKRQKREDDNYRQKEKDKKNPQRRLKRENEEVREKEKEQRNPQRRLKRENKEVREKEKELKNPQRRLKRKNEEVREKEKEQRNPQRRLKRENEEVREKEKEQRNPQRRLKRENTEVREKEKEQRNPQRRLKRENTEVREKEKEQRNPQRRLKRENKEVREKEKELKNPQRRLKRKNEEVREKEKDLKNPQRRLKRENEEVREMERHVKRQKREDDNYRQKEKELKTPQRRLKRENKEVREKEKEQRNPQRRLKRENEEVREKEKDLKNPQRRLKRENKEVREKERKIRNSQRKERRKNLTVLAKQRYADRKSKRKQRVKLTNLDTSVNIFRDLMKRGDDFVCTCCEQTFYQHSVYLASRSSYEKKDVPQSLLDMCLLGTVSCSNSEWICKTCHKYLCDKKIPPMSKANGFAMFDLPDDLKQLKPTDTEERCSALRIPFMQIKQLGAGKQYGLYGNTVNVPMNPADVVHVLPRRFEDTDTIHLEFKRRLQYKSAFAHETVRPKVIYDLCQYLIQTSDLYKEEGIHLNTDWFDETDDKVEEKDFVSDADKEKLRLADSGSGNDKEEEKPDDDWSEVTEEEMSTGNRDTMLQNLDFTDDGKHALQVAPGEKNHPVSLYMDTNAEEKSFPVLFAGKQRPSNRERHVPVKYSTICKAELRNKDRRFAMSVSNLFFKLKKLQTLQVKDAVLTALRKTKGSDYTAGQLKNKNVITELLRHDEGYSILRTIRSSPPYYQGKQKELFALIRQLGMPTFFATFSAAETRWLDLLGVLYHKQEGQTLQKEELQKLNWMQKASLIQKDPVTCSRHFNYRSQLFLNNILRSEISPIGKVSDFFIRVEFQQRGSPHLHCLFWVDGAPAYGSTTEETIIQFIDSTISCSSDVNQEDKQFIQLQTHKHTQSCKKMGRKECRFGFPIKPMKQTLILDPLSKDTDKASMKKHKDDLLRVNDIINSLSQNCEMTFEAFLDKCNLDYTSYILAVRAGLQRKQVFLKRRVCDVRINAYNMGILRIWQANTDLQFVLDPWAVCAYIASYMMKSQRGMSKLLQSACNEAQAGNHGVKEKMRIIGNKFLNHCEVSAQEASYLLEQRPLTQCSRDVVFINTSTPTERVHILKPKDALDALPDDSTEVTCMGLPERYAERPEALKKLTLAEYTSYFQRYPKKKKTLKEDEDMTDRVDVNIEEIEAGQEFLLKNGDRLVRRRIPKGIRYVHYNKEKDPELFYREQLMLFYPWDNEMNLMGTSSSYKEQFQKVQGEIQAVKGEFDKCGEALEAAKQEIDEEVLLEEVDSVAPAARQSEEDAGNLKQDADDHGFLQPGKQHKTYDIGPDLGCSSETHREVVIRNKYADEDFRKLVQSLNEEQKHFFNHVLHAAKAMKTEPFYYFLSGGAGVGKSHVLKAIYQALLRFYDTISGENPDEAKIIIGAVTAKSAFNVRGNTLHSLFAIPANQSLKSYYSPGHSKLNSLRCQYSKLRLLIIDEISMVGLNMFNFVDNRLQEIFGTTQPFGGLSLLLVGDMFQLRPVLDGWVFLNSGFGYGPLALNTWQEVIQLYELKTVMRQRDDVPFANVLNRIREGKHTEADINVIRSRLVSAGQHPELSPYLHLFSTNQSVDDHNTTILQSLSTYGCISVAVDFTIGDVPTSVRQTVLELAKDLKPQKTQNLVQQLQLKVSAQYMIVQNIDTLDGLTNGAPCTLMHFQHYSSKPHTVWVKFFDEDIGQKVRRENKHLYTQGIDKKWTPIFVIDRQFQVGRYKNVQVTRRQFPLRPSAAITVHKAQGMSVSDVVLSFKGKKVQSHMMYVALSRVTSLEGLHLLDFDKSNIRVDANVIHEMQRLRSTKMLDILPTPLQAGKEVVTILSHNARSLHKHISDISSDVNIPHADILIFQETWAMEIDGDDFYHLPGFHLIHKLFSKPCAKSRPHCGTFVYMKPNIKLCEVEEMINSEAEGLFLQCEMGKDKFQILSIYKSPRGKVTTVAEMVKSVCVTDDPLFILGDLNIDHLKPGPELDHLKTFMLDHLHARPLLKEETTDNHTCIDQIYVRDEDARCGVLETYWSDHKMIWVDL